MLGLEVPVLGASARRLLPVLGAWCQVFGASACEIFLNLRMRKAKRSRSSQAGAWRVLIITPTSPASPRSETTTSLQREPGVAFSMRAARSGSARRQRGEGQQSGSARRASAGRSGATEAAAWTLARRQRGGSVTEAAAWGVSEQQREGRSCKACRARWGCKTCRARPAHDPPP
jgi:hypothetical protein